MADYVSPEARRRIATGLMAAQYDRATPEEGNVAQRHGLLPLATYDNGRTGLAFPGFVADPVQSFNRLLHNGYTSGDTQGVEDAFNVAGAAMMGGLAAPKPKAAAVAKPAALADPMDQMIADVIARNAAKNKAIGEVLPSSATGPQTLRGYSGSDTASHFDTGFTRGPWASPSSEVANTYANTNNGRRGNVSPMEFRFNNPVEINAGGNLWRDIPVSGGIKATTNEMAIHARNAGHDGIIFKDVRDNLSFGGDPGDVYHALKRGTVYSPLTGDLLYANGGRPGATAGAALGGVNLQDPALAEILRKYGLDVPSRPASPQYRPGDA